MEEVPWKHHQETQPACCMASPQSDDLLMCQMRKGPRATAYHCAHCVCRAQDSGESYLELDSAGQIREDFSRLSSASQTQVVERP
jgi:hypothetical protein